MQVFLSSSRDAEHTPRIKTPAPSKPTECASTDTLQGFRMQANTESLGDLEDSAKAGGAAVVERVSQTSR